jgi:hypothetical protein
VVRSIWSVRRLFSQVASRETTRIEMPEDAVVPEHLLHRRRRPRSRNAAGACSWLSCGSSESEGFSKAGADAPQTRATAGASLIQSPATRQCIRDHVSDLEDLGEDKSDAALSKKSHGPAESASHFVRPGRATGRSGSNEGWLIQNQRH